jgi:hypothetical protein
MHYAVYEVLHTEEGYSTFDFFSIGQKGVILKRIDIFPAGFEGVYILFLGDVDIDNRMDCWNISDNGDRDKVLSTVIHVIDKYLEKYPDRKISFTGSTKERTRLYRMLIGSNYDALSEKFEIYCKTNAGKVLFQKNVSADYFLINKKVNF